MCGHTASPNALHPSRPKSAPFITLAELKKDPVLGLWTANRRPDRGMVRKCKAPSESYESSKASEPAQPRYGAVDQKQARGGEHRQMKKHTCRFFQVGRYNHWHCSLWQWLWRTQLITSRQHTTGRPSGETRTDRIYIQSTRLQNQRRKLPEVQDRPAGGQPRGWGESQEKPFFARTQICQTR